MLKKVQAAFEKLQDYCERVEYKGYDPYDGLNSRVFQAIPLVRDNRLARLVWIQGFKHSPVNLRPLLGVAKGYNPKALGLFLSYYCALYRKEGKAEQLEKIRFFIDRIEEAVTPGWSGACWGYNFDWQARAFFQPKYTPTVVASTFIANALLDAYEILEEEHLLKMARSTCDFILNDLNRTNTPKGTFAFSYSPLDKSVVFNASLLGSKLLARVCHYTRESKLYEEAKNSVEFCCAYQQADGSWPYGTYSFHQWIDNFHTGYNLECISDFMKYTGDTDYKLQVERGFDYYLNTFFTEEGIPKYYNNSVYPIDIHAPAQLIITLVRLGALRDQRELADRVLNWTIDNMQSPRGYFYFQRKKYFKSRIPYIRWAQAWMFYALSHYLSHVEEEQADPFSTGIREKQLNLKL
jgi:hypothetical protein